MANVIKKMQIGKNGEQTAEIILDSFAKHLEIDVALEHGITARERFDVRPVGQSSGYMVQDQLFQPFLVDQ
jgi:hypothetical protein